LELERFGDYEGKPERSIKTEDKKG